MASINVRSHDQTHMGFWPLKSLRKSSLVQSMRVQKLSVSKHAFVSGVNQVIKLWRHDFAKEIMISLIASLQHFPRSCSSEGQS